MTSPDDEVGDPVCWLHQLCPACGAVPTDGAPDRCWRCGAERPAGEDTARPPA